MKRIIITLILCLTTIGFVFAETIDIAPFLPVSPRVMAQGGSFVAVAEGYESLFYNPAGFARTKFDLTVPSIGLWLYMNPASVADFVESLPEEGAALGPEEEAAQIAAMTSLINEQVGSGGIGLGTSVGAGFVANGLGLGTSLVIDAYLQGAGGMADAEGDVIATLGGVAGYAIDLELAGMKLNVGADLRPMYRIHSFVENQDALSMVSQLLNNDPGAALELIQNTTALTGFGMGIDLGAILEMGPLSVGLSMRDLFGTKFAYYNNTVQGVIDSLTETGEIPADPATEVTENTYMIPMDISAGVAFNIDVLKPLLDLTVHGDIQDVIGVIKYKRTPWTLIHIGAEAKLLEMIRLRAGFNQGYITMGAGVHLLFLDLNVALFTRELGKHIGDQPNSGATLELALRL